MRQNALLARGTHPAVDGAGDAAGEAPARPALPPHPRGGGEASASRPPGPREPPRPARSSAEAGAGAPTTGHCSSSAMSLWTFAVNAASFEAAGR
jgi:hypothetical protein